MIYSFLLSFALFLPGLPSVLLDAPPALRRPLPASVDTLRLDALRAAAARQDPQALQPALFEAATRLRLASLRRARLPQIVLSGQATWQSDVPSFDVAPPGAVGTPLGPPQEQFRAQAEADWTLYDGGRIARQQQAERARLAEQLAGVNASLHALEDAATDAFFGAALFQAQAQTLAAAAEAAAGRLVLLRRRVAEGAALSAEAAVLEAEAIRLRQHAAEAAADRRAALAVLGALTGTEIPLDAVLTLPDLEDATRVLALTLADVAAPTPTLTALVDRPEVQQRRRQADRLAAEARVLTARTRPQVNLFGQAGVGRPNPLDFISDETQEFALVGVRARWSVLDWGRARKEAEAARLQAQIAATQADALARRFARAVAGDLADIERLQTALNDDDRAVALREEALDVARARLDNGVILPADYADALLALTDAQLARERHRIEQAQAQARLLSTLGRLDD